MGNSSSSRSTLLHDNSTNEIISGSREMLSRAGFDDNYIDYFSDCTVGLLNDYAELTGEGTEIEYSLKKRLTKIDLRILIPGESFDPFENGSEANRRQAEKLTDLNLNSDLPTVSYKYESSENRVSISVPLSERKKNLLSDPTIMAIILGIAAGFICLHLPDEMNSFIIEDIASPVQSTLLGAISAIMGPYIFISMATTITSMNSISELTNLGWRIVKRFTAIILFVIAVSILVSGFFFNSFGTAQMSYSPDELIDIVLNIIPTNLIQPFIDNNTAQLVVLGVLLGSALLLLDEKVTGLNDILTQADQWIVSAMNIVLKLTPAIPFLSLMILIGRGNFSIILKGWKWIAAVYISFTIVVIVKAVKMSLKTGMSIPDFWNRIRPAVRTAFTTGSNAAAMKEMYEASEELGIDPEFSSFWIPICSSMLGTKTALYVVTATLMTAELCGMAMTNSFMLVLILVTLELSLASPGAASAWTTMFTVLGMSTDYVGIFTSFRVLTDNFCVGATEAHSMMEQYEAAWKLGGMKSDAEVDEI